MITLKTPEELEIFREGGRRHAVVLTRIAETVRPGILASELNNLAMTLVRESGGKPAFLNYKPRGARRPYPAALCVSVNDEIVHGIPNENEKILREGDIVSLDLGFSYQGLITDMAVTVPVGRVGETAKSLIDATAEALELGVAAVKSNGAIGDIGAAIQSFVKKTGFSLAEGLAGHGVGYAVHEDPYVPNSGRKGNGEKLQVGMVLALEPMLCEGSGKIVLAPDGYTYKTADGRRSAHFENTVVVTENGAEVLTKI
ncbi:MAG: Methionine aminopeptidase [Parcubacteria group bacterium GW2011_GWA2_47_21]|nr:MAG: Methionine aminopeptidase [Parcubacteria group bacterium GW2011_GWA2_47_21]